MADESEHNRLLAGDDLTEEEKARAKLDLAALADEDLEDGMDTGETEASPVIKTSQNGMFRFAMVFVTLFPGKQIHYGRFIPLHPLIFRTFCSLFPEFAHDSDLYALL